MVVVVGMVVVVVVIVVVSYLGILRPVNHTRSPQEEPDFHSYSKTRRNGSHQNTSKTTTTTTTTNWLTLLHKTQSTASTSKP